MFVLVHKQELISACEKGDLKTVRRLSSQVTVRDVRDSRGWSPLHYAARLVIDSGIYPECCQAYCIIMLLHCF